MADEGTPKKRGCLFYAAIVVIVFSACVIAGLIFAVKQVKQLTDPAAVTLPTVQLPPDQMQNLHDRIEDFSTTIQQGETPEPLALTSAEVNALIASDTNLVTLRNHVYVSMEGEQLGAQVSFPAEDLGLSTLHGRFVNATGTFSVSLEPSGLLRVGVEMLSVKGKPLPEKFLRQIKGQNLAAKIISDPRISLGLSKLQDIKVQDGKLVVIARKR